MNVTKVSDITSTDLAEYLRLDATEEDLNTLNSLLSVAINYVKQYTGRTDEELDTLGDVPIVIFILVQDMWDNRTLYPESNNANKVVESILGLHSVNLL